MKLFVAITFHYNPDKLVYLKRALDSLETIKTERTHVVISTNDVTDDQLNTIKELNTNLDIFVEPVRRLYHPFFLAWNHKKYMLHFMSTDFTHFLYMEDDLKITQENIDYWIEHREFLVSKGVELIPAHHRIEFDNDGRAYSVDSVESIPISGACTFTIDDKKYILLPRPYQAMFLMDKDLVHEHIFSPSFRFETSFPYNGAWLIQDTASQGNMFTNVTFDKIPHRMVIPVDDFERSWIHHMTDNYVNDPESQHSKILVEKVFYE